METENLEFNIVNVEIGPFYEEKKVLEMYNMQTLRIWFD